MTPKSFPILDNVKKKYVVDTFNPKMTEDNFNEITHFQYQIDPKRLNFMVLGCDSRNFAFTVMETQKLAKKQGLFRAKQHPGV